MRAVGISSVMRIDRNLMVDLAIPIGLGIAFTAAIFFISVLAAELF
jgi:hypothetical protein